MNGLLRASVRGLAGFVSSRPALVNFASRVLARFPFLKRRLRILMSGRTPPPRRSEEALGPDEARALVDLREAVAARGRAKP